MIGEDPPANKENIMKSLKKGFTLVELMVVIVIIGILAALAIPRFLGATNKTKAAEFKPVLKQIYTLQEAYKQERDVYGLLTEIAFEQPAVTSRRFDYSEAVTGVAPIVTAVSLAKAVPNAAGLQMRCVDNTNLTIADFAWVNNQGVQSAATACLGNLSSLPILAMP